MNGVSKPARQSETRDKLIDAALAVVARVGLGETNVKAIAQEAGVAPGLVHYHFQNKDEVLLAAVERAGAIYVAALDSIIESNRADTIYQAYLDYARGSLAEHRPLFALRLGLATRAIHDAELGERLARGDAEINRRVARIIACHAGRDGPDEDDLLEATMVKAAFEGMMLAWLSRPGFSIEASLDRFATAMRNSRR